MDDSFNAALLETAESRKINYIEDDNIDEAQCMYILNVILSVTARLNVLLPSFTILAFTIFVPLLTNDGKCSNLDRWLMGTFWGVSAISCIFFSITDSFRGINGRLYYGVATVNGIWAFNGGRKRPMLPTEYKLRWSDIYHTLLSVIAFLTFAALHNDVQECYYPGFPRKVTNTVPLVVGFIVSVLFVVFPSKRRGIGHPFLLQKDPLYSRV